MAYSFVHGPISSPHRFRRFSRYFSIAIHDSLGQVSVSLLSTSTADTAVTWHPGFNAHRVHTTPWWETHLFYVSTWILPTKWGCSSESIAHLLVPWCMKPGIPHRHGANCTETANHLNEHKIKGTHVDLQAGYSLVFHIPRSPSVHT